MFFGLFAMRAFTSQRRHQGRQRGSPPASSFTEPTFSKDGSDVAEAPSDQVAFGGVPPGWFRDPSGRHEQRYWSGSAWTEHVTDRGIPGTDPPPHTGHEAPSS